MQGRDGPTSKPEILLSLFSALCSLHFGGFIVSSCRILIYSHFFLTRCCCCLKLPILNKFHKAKSISSIFGVICVLFIILAATPVGFPYTKDVTPQRFYVLVCNFWKRWVVESVVFKRFSISVILKHTQRIIHDQSGVVVKNDTGFYVQPVDTRPYSLDDSTLKNALPQAWTDEQCETEIFCGLPLYSSRWMNWK